MLDSKHMGLYCPVFSSIFSGQLIYPEQIVFATVIQTTSIAPSSDAKQT